jgi:hypothetical protein
LVLLDVIFLIWMMVSNSSHVTPLNLNQTRRTDIPSLREDNPQEENEEQNTGSNPAIGGVRG